ncbi:MAG: creatininase family protein [Cyanobacteria bacterium J06648_11]
MHGFIPPRRFLPYLSWTDVRDLPDKPNTVVIQPIGSVEQHGPHLPAIVDSAIATAVIGKALEQLDDAIPAYALPTLCYGKSNEHDRFPSTITLSATTLQATLMEVGESLYRSGFRKWAIANAHGGQPQTLDIIARDLHQQYEDFAVFPLFIWNVPNCAAELLTAKELELGIHAGDAETSLMLAIAPDLVRTHRAIAEYPRHLPADSLLSMEGKLPFAWTTRDLSRSGVLGDATVATRDKGERMWAALAAGWVRAIADIHRFEPPRAWQAAQPERPR